MYRWFPMLCTEGATQGAAQGATQGATQGFEGWYYPNHTCLNII